MVLNTSVYRMVKTKKTLCKSDVKGRLPPLAALQHSREGWGPADETFHKRLTLPMDPQRGNVSYKGTWIVMSNVSNMSYFANELLQYTVYFSIK